jgi:hypothetical protein|nr:hypothetical protein [Klebsiella pneumoniae]
MTKSTITRERLEEIVSDPMINQGSEFAMMARMALAAMDSEPVAEVYQPQNAGICAPLGPSIRMLYPLEPGANLYRHAQPAPEYPETLPCPVLLEPGLRFGKGIKTSTMLAALARRAVYESDMAALSPEEKAEFQARIEGFKALIAQPVPVVPQDVLDALQKVARIRLDLNDFDGDRRGIADCLGDAEEALIEVVNRRADMLHAGNSPAQSDCCPAKNCIHSAQGVDRPIAWHHSAKSKEGNHGTCCFSYASSHDFGPGYEKPQSHPHYLPERLDYDRALHFLSTEPRKVTLETVIGGNSPAIPDGYVMVPMRLTAENGAKGALSGEFSETKFVNCPECFGDDECETCDGSGRIEITVPVTWTTIKEIWAKGVEHFAATPREVKGE